MTTAIPDPLRRFVPTPYGCKLPHRWGELLIESNNASLAGDLIDYVSTFAPGSLLQAVDHLKIVVERSLDEDVGELTRVDANRVRTLLRGTTTMLIYDIESRELLAFLEPQVSCNEFFQRLLPAIVYSEWPPSFGWLPGGITNA
jgi:hypothetical protein